MSAAHRAGALTKMKEHHAEAVRLRTSDPAASRRAAKRAEHAADVVKSIDSGAPGGLVDPTKDFSPGYFRSGGSTTTTTPSDTTIPVWKKGVRTRMGYDPDGMIDYTNTNPAYWTSVISYYKGNPEGNKVTGELGIWIPNFEKEGAERTALAAIAGGVTAHVDSNYANRTVSDEYARALHARREGPTSRSALASYTGGAEKVIRLAGVHRGGTDVDTGYPMGSTDPVEHGVHIKGGKVVKGAGTDYVKGGGDFGGLLGLGDKITGSWLDGILGPMDKDGMRIRGTYPAAAGATGSGLGAGGTKTTVGGVYASGVDPLASMPKVADYTAYMDPNSMFGGLSENAAVKSGLLYQPMASDYGAKMEAAGLPAFSPGLLGSFTSSGGPTYSSAPSGFKKTTTKPSGTSTIIGGSGTRYMWPEYFSGDVKSRYPILSKDAPKFASSSALYGRYGGGDPYAKYMKAFPTSGGFAKIMDTGTVYRTGTGTEYIDASSGEGWIPGRAYPATKT